MHSTFLRAHRARFSKMFLVASAFATMLAPSASWACACGCGIFDVGAISLPSEATSGLSVWFRYSYMNQDQNWEGTSKAPAADNGDKDILTDFYTIGAEYMVNSDWTVMAELPTFQRNLTTTDDPAGDATGVPNEVYTGHLTDLGDAQVMGVYTGLSSDMTTGLGFGVKLPTGNYTGPIGPGGGPLFDRDSLPGTGSTDLIFTAYHVGALTNDEALVYFAQARYQMAVLTRDSYRPGNELDGAIGLNYNFGSFGPLDKLAGVLQMLGSYRMHDTGFNADPYNSGYRRLLIAPGADIQIKSFRFYADVELPIYQDTNASWWPIGPGITGDTVDDGNTKGQLIAKALFKVQLAYDF